MRIPHRRRWAALVAVAVLAGAAAARYAWLPHYRPALRDGERYGIDVSRHQGAIDWPRVARDGIGFAYVKATEGGDHTDSRFTANWSGARAAGLDTGAYHFFTLCAPGAAQARHFLATVPAGLALPPAVDLELAGNCHDRPDEAAVRRELDAFLAAVEARTHTKTVLYVGADFEHRYPVRTSLGRPLWHPRFLRRPGGPWAVWQVMGLARVEGVGGVVDLDVGTVRAWPESAYSSSTTTPSSAS